MEYDIVTIDEDYSCQVLFNNIIRPRLSATQQVHLMTKYNNGINYTDSMCQVEDLLKDAIVVGHDIINNITASDHELTKSFLHLSRG